MTTAPKTALKVLLVDDHPVVRAGLRAVLEGFEDLVVVDEASDGAAALASWECLTAVGNGPDVVVMDLQMPGPAGDGVDGITATRRFVAAGGPPMLVLTTFDTAADIVAAVRAGAKGYLLKDAEPDTVAQAVRNTAAGRTTLSGPVSAALAGAVADAALALSERETEVLRAVATGATNREIARALFVSEATVKTHLVHVYEKLNVENRTAAVRAARERRLI